MAHNMTKSTAFPTVNSNYGLSYHGRIINLDDFRGDVVIEDSAFENNTIALSDCSVQPSNNY